MCHICVCYLVITDPTATCLVMTTEILRSMLYRGSELMREVAWVIYDEVHYMRDSERGVVWEESIVLLPHRVRFVFLSATIPNASQFADWICEIHHQPCHVVYTNYRPVPLQVSEQRERIRYHFWRSWSLTSTTSSSFQHYISESRTFKRPWRPCSHPV